MIEILAPAGDLISLKSAIASDTDAVYLGLSAFNARIKAENFTTENIKDTVDYCHLFGVKALRHDKYRRERVGEGRTEKYHRRVRTGERRRFHYHRYVSA